MLFICLSVDITLSNHAPMFFAEFDEITSEQTRIDSSGGCGR